MPAPQLIVDLGAIRSNYKHYRRLQGDVAAVVKANAYGLGMGPVARTLERAGCQDFFVATIEEGESLRRILNHARIIVLSGPIVASDVERLRRAVLIPVINHRKQLALFGSSRPPVIVHLDTGMNRLGFRDITEAKRCVEGFPVAMVMSHYACADDPANPMNEKQASRFSRWCAHFPGTPSSVANSAAALGEPAEGIARVGLGLTGASPLRHGSMSLTPAVRVEVSVAGVYALRRGESVGYGGTYTALDDERVAVLAIGYADGVPRSLGNRGAFYGSAGRLPIRGNISMDLTVIALPDDQRLQLGDRVEWFGESQSLDQVAADAETINYEILASIGSRVERRYIDDDIW